MEGHHDRAGIAAARAAREPAPGEVAAGVIGATGLTGRRANPRALRLGAALLACRLGDRQLAALAWALLAQAAWQGAAAPGTASAGRSRSKPSQPAASAPSPGPSCKLHVSPPPNLAVGRLARFLGTERWSLLAAEVCLPPLAAAGP